MYVQAQMRCRTKWTRRSPGTTACRFVYDRSTAARKLSLKPRVRRIAAAGASTCSSMTSSPDRKSRGDVTLTLSNEQLRCICRPTCSDPTSNTRKIIILRLQLLQTAIIKLCVFFWTTLWCGAFKQLSEHLTMRRISLCQCHALFNEQATDKMNACFSPTFTHAFFPLTNTIDIISFTQKYDVDQKLEQLDCFLTSNVLHIKVRNRPQRLHGHVFLHCSIILTWTPRQLHTGNVSIISALCNNHSIFLDHNRIKCMTM